MNPFQNSKNYCTNDLCFNIFINELMLFSDAYFVSSRSKTVQLCAVNNTEHKALKSESADPFVKGFVIHLIIFPVIKNW